MKTRRFLPTIALNWLLEGHACLVGSGAKSYIDDGDMPRDLDFIVRPDHWQAVLRTIPREVTVEINSFGGLKFNLNSVAIDLWPQHLEDFLANHHTEGYVVRLQPYYIIYFRPGT